MIISERLTVRVLLTILLAAGVFPLRAHREPQGSGIYGPGAHSCGQWSEEARSKDAGLRNLYQAWVLGYVSGAGHMLDALDVSKAGISQGFAVIRKSDRAAMVGWMDAHCAANPLKSISDAALVLAQELMTPRR